MTRVEFLTSGTKLCGFYISGHAGYSEYGQDVVCASISAVSQMVYNALGQMFDKPDIVGYCNDDTATMYVEVYGNDALAKVEVMMAALLSYLSDLEDKYPKFLRVSVKEDKPNGD